MKESCMSTESRNPNSMNIYKCSTLEMVQIINNEDKKVANCISPYLIKIAEIIDLISEKYKLGGRLIYVGAGTSGRLGVLDAAELVPTFGIDSDRAIGLIAGGKEAMFKAIENSEDSFELGKEDLIKNSVSNKDVVIGIAASGRTPYVIGALKYAENIGALTVGISNNSNSEISKYCDQLLEIVVGPEVITGSTRMKAGTAQKMILNMISTSVMIKMGKVYQNLMIDVQTTNKKLIDRGIRIIKLSTNVSEDIAKKTLEEANFEVNTAILMIIKSINADESRKLINKGNGLLSEVIE
ncbi:N-acetylmuramic acid 6-phosphate etherase [Companilactobacillus sp. HBUAS59544]|jgi:N-acetylmuramic acid 6-phosphate etherase|uniref:N-acetylmuramic acid 6-phosphate etherase n=1 Tax=Companilactobacillus sp. HBUAS59544 TaxID=3109363 RepID=UPI002FEF4CA9